MTDLKKLRVSLTKHGAHKVAELIKAFPKDEVLNNLWDTYREIKIDRAQTEKNLSVDSEGKVPEIWDNVRQLGNKEIDNLILIAIIFSHHQLIETMKESKTREMQGKIIRGKGLDGKAYTNFACILDELEFSLEHTYEYVTYDLSSLFVNPKLPTLVINLLRTKLVSAGWDEKGDIIDECIRLQFNDVFAISKDKFRKWMEGIAPSSYSPVIEQVEIEQDNDEQEEKPFEFISEDTPQVQGIIKVHSVRSLKVMHLRHNEIENKLFDYFVDKFGNDAVHREVLCGSGKIDIVVKENGSYIFYEIKTENSVRSSIRQAIPQLLEYAYWPQEMRAQTLIIVTHKPATSKAVQYLKHLREVFNLPIYYQYFDLAKCELGKRQ